jgi:hypothetical protein
MLIGEIDGMFTCAPINSKVYLPINLLVNANWRPTAWIVQVFLLQRSQRNTFLTSERMDLEDDPQVALAALELRGLWLQVSQCRRGRLGQDWHPLALSTPFSWACIEYKLTGERRATRRAIPLRIICTPVSVRNLRLDCTSTSRDTLTLILTGGSSLTVLYPTKGMFSTEIATPTPETTRLNIQIRMATDRTMVAEKMDVTLTTE